MKISNGSKKRCREKFNYKGIGSLINKAVYLIEIVLYKSVNKLDCKVYGLLFL